MARADPTRSDYAASRHLLRHLDDAAELRRNALVHDWFPSAALYDRRARGAALERVRSIVLAALTRWRVSRRTPRERIALGRMYAVLLRCELERATLAVVAAELGLSERQARRERRAAHEGFLAAFREAAGGATRVPVPTAGSLRLAIAAALHELGADSVAIRTCEAIALETQDRGLRHDALRLAAHIARTRRSRR